MVGSLLGIYLSKRGHTISVYERRPDMRLSTGIAGRSINLALSDRGIKALEEVGIMEEIRKIAIPMHGRFIHKADGTTAYQPYGKEGQFINSVSRAQLNMKLMDLAEKKGVEIHFDKRLDRINFETNELFFGDETSVKSDIIFGGDGAFSAARLTHQMQHDRFQYQQYYIDFGYKELTIPAGNDGSFLIEKNALHIWPRGNYMLIALPNMDGSFTCTLFFPFEGEPSFQSLNTPLKAKQFFDTVFPDAALLITDFEKQFFTVIRFADSP